MSDFNSLILNSLGLSSGQVSELRKLKDPLERQRFVEGIIGPEKAAQLAGPLIQPAGKGIKPSLTTNQQSYNQAHPPYPLPPPAGVILHSESQGMSLTKETEKTIARAGASAVIGGAASFAIYKRRGVADMFGTRIPEYALDGAICGLDSVGADLLGGYALPALEKKFVGSPKLANMIKFSVPPAIAGATQYAVKEYVVGTRNGLASEFVLGAGTKLIADGVVNAWM